MLSDSKNLHRKIFVLGDSRTGTTTIHAFLKRAGLRSIHYFFKESGVTDPPHLEHAQNWNRLKDFIEDSGYDAFSDYPLRTFYVELFQQFPDALFILSTRKNIETWRNSMLNFFSKFNIELNIDALTDIHIRINSEIRSLAKSKNVQFCEICIDDDYVKNGALLSQFLELKDHLQFGHENSSSAYDPSVWSGRVALYNKDSADALQYVKDVTHPSKALLSEHGWVYLINDGSDFLDYFFGEKSWSASALNAAVQTMKDRAQWMTEQNISYIKIIVPEKVAVYPEYLPKVFSPQRIAESRPAILLSHSCDFVHYPQDILLDAKSYGFLYFRGDSHANWLGAFFLYQEIVTLLSKIKFSRPVTRKPAFPLWAFKVELASYAGDLFVQLDPELKNHFSGAWEPLQLGGNKIEYLIKYTLADEHRKAKRLPVAQELLQLLGDRETFRYSHPDKSLPKAVIFRDSTSEYLVECLAEHFSESLFVWHKGMVYEDIVKSENPDLVLHIMAERFVVQYERFDVKSKIGL